MLFCWNNRLRLWATEARRGVSTPVAGRACRVSGGAVGGCAWFITDLVRVRQILEHLGERATTPVIAPARSPPLAMN